MDVGAEVSWVPATTAGGTPVRTTFLLAAAQFRPWDTQGFFVRGSVGMAFVRNFVYDGTGTLPPITSKALGPQLRGRLGVPAGPIVSGSRCSARTMPPRSAISRPPAGSSRPT